MKNLFEHAYLVYAEFGATSEVCYSLHSNVFFSLIQLLQLLSVFCSTAIFVITGLDISTRPLAQAIKIVWESTNHLTITCLFGEYNFCWQEII